jgi:cell division protein FtsA
MRKIYTSVDIGSDTIKFLVAEEGNDTVNVLASAMVKSKGIKKGLIVDSNQVVMAIKDGAKQISEQLGFDIKNVIVNVPDYNAKFMYVTGKINVDGVIATRNINTVIKDSVYNKLDKDYELVTVIPLEFTLDGKEKTLYPYGKECHVLEIKGIMISVPKKNIYSVISVFPEAGLDVLDITISGIADYYQVRNKKIDNKIGAIINIGHETTNVSVINNGIIMNTETIQLGGINVENDIAYIFGTNIIDARKIKEKFASSHKRFTNLNETYDLDGVKLNQLEVTEVVMSRLTEMLNLARKQISLLTKKDIEYIIITGGLTEIKHFKNLVYEILGKDVIIFTEDTLGVRDNKYITALGMIKYLNNKMETRGREYSMFDKDEEEALINPNKNKKDKMNVAKIFGNFIGTKED